MKTKGSTASILAVLLVGGVCFFAGKWSVAGAAASASVPPSSAGASGAGADGSRNESSRRSGETVRVEQAKEVDGAGKSASFPVPRKAARELLEKELKHTNPERIAGEVASALDVIAATEEEKKAVLAAVEKMRQDIFAEEKRTAVVKEETASSLVMDMSGMAQPLKEIIARLESDIYAALPGDKAWLLNSSFNWENFYPANALKDMAFSIERNEKGQFMATRRYPMMREGMGVHPSAFPDNGTPLPADKVFIERWAVLLEGRTLLPIDRPEKGQ